MTALTRTSFGSQTGTAFDYWESITPCTEKKISNLTQLDNLVLEYCLAWQCHRHLQVGRKMLIPPDAWGWVVPNFDSDLWEVLPAGTHDQVAWFTDWQSVLLAPQFDLNAIPPTRRGVPQCSQEAQAMMMLLHHHELEWHGEMKTPFEPGSPYFAGFTPHGTSGFNGKPDYYASGSCLKVAVCRAALLTKGLAVVLST